MQSDRVSFLMLHRGTLRCSAIMLLIQSNTTPSWMVILTHVSPCDHHIIISHYNDTAFEFVLTALAHSEFTPLDQLHLNNVKPQTATYVV